MNSNIHRGREIRKFNTMTPLLFWDKAGANSKKWSNSSDKNGDINASIPTLEPVIYREMFGVHGDVAYKTGVIFTLKATIVLIQNGLCRIHNVDAKSTAIMNIFEGHYLLYIIYA